MEGEVPRRVPRVLPLIRHRDDVGIVEVGPVAVTGAGPLAFGRRRRRVRIAVEPERHVVQIILLRPDQPGERLPLHEASIRVLDVVLKVRVISIRLADALREDAVEERDGAGFGERAGAASGRALSVGESHLDDRTSPGRDAEAEVGGGLRAAPLVIHGRPIAPDHVFVKGVLPEADFLFLEEPRVGFVLGEEQFRFPVNVEVVVAETVVRNREQVRPHPRNARSHRVRLPTPRVAKPDLREDVEFRGGRAAVVRRDSHQHFVRPGLGVLHEHVEVAVAVEDAGVEQFELRVARAALVAFLEQLRVRERTLRVLVEELQVALRGRGVEVVVKLLDVFAVVALGVVEPEEAFL